MTKIEILRGDWEVQNCGREEVKYTFNRAWATLQNKYKNCMIGRL